MSQRLRVLIAAEYHILYTTLSMLIELSDDLELIEEVATREDVVPKTLAHQPDILLLDPRVLKNMDSAILFELQALAPNMQIGLLTETWPTYHSWGVLAKNTVRYKPGKISSERLLRAICTYVDGEALTLPRLPFL